MIQELASNPVFGGMVGGSMVAGALYSLKALPGQLWKLLLWRFTVEVRLLNNDAAFFRAEEWLASLDYAQHARRLRATTRYEEDGREQVCSPGEGKHWLWHSGRLLIVERGEYSGKGGGWNAPTEQISIRSVGPDPTFLHGLLAEIQDVRGAQRSKTVDVFLYRSYWRLACRKPKRALDSVILPPEQLARIVGDIDRFLGARDWYTKRGVPYRRGYLLEGPPGCGKTSLVMALAGHFRRPVYALNLGSLPNDDALIEAVTSVPEHAILLIEDIDATEASATRTTAEPGVIGEKKEEAKALTLSGLLNAIDGVFSRDGRILVMTTNHPEKIDPALLRPGRADVREHLGHLQRREVLAMCRQFVEDPCRAAEIAESIRDPIAPAELQGRLLLGGRS